MQTIGERLEEARKRKGISIREAAEATKIRGDYLQRFENNQFDINLSELYVRGFLRTYSNFLKLPAERVVSDYRALAPSTDEKPRTPNREVYGRMDLSIASANGSSKSKNDDLPPEPVVADAGDKGDSRPRTFARIGTSLPDMPMIEGRLLMRIGAIAGAVLLVILVIWGIKSAVSNSSSSSAKRQPAVAAAPAEQPMITIYAIDSVRVKLVQASDSKEILPTTTLVRGETRSFPRTGKMLLTYSEGKNVELEYGGNRYKMPTAGWDQVNIPAPTP